MSLTLNLKPEVEAGLLAQAQATGLTLERYVQRLFERELSEHAPDIRGAQSSSGMVWENGLFVYRTGHSLPTQEIDDIINRVRDDRTRHILGDLS